MPEDYRDPPLTYEQYLMAKEWWIGHHKPLDECIRLARLHQRDPACGHPANIEGFQPCHLDAGHGGVHVSRGPAEPEHVVGCTGHPDHTGPCQVSGQRLSVEEATALPGRNGMDTSPFNA